MDEQFGHEVLLNSFSDCTNPQSIQALSDDTFDDGALLDILFLGLSVTIKAVLAGFLCCY